MGEPFDTLKLIWLAKETPEQTDHISRLIDIDFYLFKFLNLKRFIEGDEKDITFWYPYSYSQFHEFVKTIHKEH